MPLWTCGKTQDAPPAEPTPHIMSATSNGFRSFNGDLVLTDTGWEQSSLALARSTVRMEERPTRRWRTIVVGENLLGTTFSQLLPGQHGRPKGTLLGSFRYATLQ